MTPAPPRRATSHRSRHDTAVRPARCPIGSASRLEKRMIVPFPRTRLRHRPLVAAALVAVLALTGAVVTTTMAAHAAPTLLSQGRPATASSVENAGTPASAAVDGN